MIRACKLLVPCLIIISILLTGCLDVNSPPDISVVEQRFQDNHKDIEIVVTFLINSEYEDVIISNPDGNLWADYETIPIQNQQLMDAVTQLLGNGEYKSIVKLGNTIELEQWDAGVQDIGCGIAYSINKTARPNVQFLTELVPLSEDGWYYYVADYNKWRINQ